MEILNYLKEIKMLDNTIIVFTSDHGQMQGSHGLKGKRGFLYENNVHVPLIIVHPEYAGGKSISAVTSYIDIAATFVDMANLTKEKEIMQRLRGNSLLRLMDGIKSFVREGSLFCYEMLSIRLCRCVQE